MFKDIAVANFRGFSKLHLKELARINLIAGMNNAGKTALLEAIHLHNNPADCQLPYIINKARGIADPGTAVEEIVAWHFSRRQPTDGLEISSSGEDGVTRELTMWLLDAASSRARFPEEERQLSEGFGQRFVDTNLPRLVLRYVEADKVPQISIGVFVGNGVLSFSAKIPWKIASVYLNSGMPSPEQDMQHFGELEAAKRQDEILPALQILETRLQRLSLVPLSGKPVIHGDIGLPRLVPMPFMGEGIRRVLSIVMAIANAAGGVVLIDEIENGLHYSVLKEVWRSVAHAARGANVQVFATTHSWECLVKAHEAFAEDQTYDFRWYRLQNLHGETQAISHDREMIEAALYSGVEIR